MSEFLRSNISRDGFTYLACGPLQQGIAFVFIHGWGCQASDFVALFVELEKQGCKCRAVAVDLPGHGKATKEAGPEPTISACASAVLSLADQLGMVQIVLIGHSMGCRIALEAWHQAQGNGKSYIKALVFLDGSHYGLRPSLFAFDKADPRSASLTEKEKAAKRQDAFDRMFSANTPQLFQASCLAHLRGVDNDCSQALRQSHLAFDSKMMDAVISELGRAGTPLLNLQSSDVDAANQRISLRVGQQTKWMRFLAEHVPGAEQVVVEDSGHFPHIDQPSFVAGQLKNLIAAVEDADV